MSLMPRWYQTSKPPQFRATEECLDHVIVFDEESLRRTLRAYIRYYHSSRLHLSLEKDAPDSRAIQPLGKVVATSQVGGLHHRYERRAA